jgi:outer membrane protein assembly factor BamB
LKEEKKMKRTIPIIGIILILILSGIPTILSFDNYSINQVENNNDEVDWWPCYRHDPQNTGASNSSVSNNISILWEYHVKGKVVESPAIMNGKVYFGCQTGKVYCLNTNDGKKIWSYDTGASSSSTPAINNGKVYICNKYHLYCLDSNNGNKIWDCRIGNQSLSNPVVSDGKVYITNSRDEIICVDTNDGNKIWSYNTGLRIGNSPAIWNGKVYIDANGGRIYCFDKNNGSNIWKYTVENGGYSTVVVSDGRIYLSNSPDELICLDAENGSSIWSSKTGQSMVIPSIYKNKIYISSNSELCCFNAINGSKNWCVDFYNPTWKSTIIADGKIYIGDGEIHCFNAEDGNEIWNYDIRNYAYNYVIADSKIFLNCVYDHNGILYCLGPNFPPNNPLVSYDRRSDEIIILATDPDGDQVRFGISWNNNYTIDYWTKFVNSDSEFRIKCNVNNGTIGVIAEDEHGAQSDWVSVKSKEKSIEYQILNRLLYRFIYCFPFFEKILNQIITIT